VGTAHVSKTSVENVEAVIRETAPDHLCVEIDASRYSSLKNRGNWENLKINEVLKQRKGFLLLANLALSSFQKRLGADLGVNPGEEMKRGIAVAEELGIPYSFADREIQVTLRRAWAKSGFWGKNKMLASLLASVFTKEKVTPEELERLKEKDVLQGMMEELAEYLPAVKEVLIDERDQYLATMIYRRPEKRVVAVVGAGHIKGIKEWIAALAAGERSSDLKAIEVIPPPSRISKIVPWIVPAAIVGILAAGFFISGWQEAVSMLWKWVLVCGTLSAVGSLLAFAHPITIAASFVAAPITCMNPTIGVGMVTGLLEWYLRKPRVQDFERLSCDIESVRGFYRNRVTHILVVFFLSSVGGSIGTFVGIPYLTTLLS
jgi:pheromone shutdown-related protein TraB